MNLKRKLRSLFGINADSFKAEPGRQLPEKVAGFKCSPEFKNWVDHGFNNSISLSNSYSPENNIRLYRFLRDSIPILNSAIWTWSAMSASPVKIEFEGEGSQKRAVETVRRMFHRIYDQRNQRFADIQALLIEYFNSLYTTGSVVGEVVASPQMDGIDYFYFIDPASLEYRLEDGHYKIYQKQDGKLVALDSPAVYFYGFNSESTNPAGRSLLRSIPFVAKVEQQLLSDMQKSMHNAGYHRLHVKVKPPEKKPGESDDSYINRANSYFEQTASMFTDFRPEDNPITWDDIRIDYIGPASQVSSSRSWYLNHKALLEDICAGTHLAPFMLGYSYGTTQNWAMFKYELVQRQVRAVQAAASGFLEWMASLELAFNGIAGRCRVSFENELIYGLNEKTESEKKRVESVVMKYKAGLIDRDEARKELESR